MRAKSRVRGASFGIFVFSLTLVACGDNNQSEVPALGIELIGPAVAAVREQQGIEPKFFEINSTAEGVNLYIAITRTGNTGTPDAVIQGRYTSEEGLVLSEEILEASGPIFSVRNLNLSPLRLASQVVEKLKNSKLLMFVLSASEVSNTLSGVVMRVILESELGGRLAVLVDIDGNILGTEVLEGSL